MRNTDVGACGIDTATVVSREHSARSVLAACDAVLFIPLGLEHDFPAPIQESGNGQESRLAYDIDVIDLDDESLAARAALVAFINISRHHIHLCSSAHRASRWANARIDRSQSMQVAIKVSTSRPLPL